MRKSWLLGLSAIILMVIVGLGLNLQQPVGVNAQSENLSVLLNDLWNRTLQEQSTDSESNFTFTITFNNSVAGLGGNITLGTNLETTPFDRVGDDYMCVRRIFSRTSTVYCVPFNNIATITFQEAAGN